MKITDLKCAILGENPVIRIVTDEGIDGYGQIESTKPYTTPHVLFFRDALIGEDPTNVERVMLKIRQRGSFKPWGSAVSAIEIALWDLAGKAAGVPVYKLLGGKVRDRVRIYNGGLRFPIEQYTPEEYAESTRKMLAAQEGFTIVKQPIGFHSQMKRIVPDFFYGDARPVGMHGALDRGALTERGLKHLIACVEAMKAVTGDARRAGARLRPRLLPERRPPLRPGHGAVQPDVAGGHDHRRLHAVRPGRSVPRRHLGHHHPDPHRRADLPAPELQRPDRQARRQRRRARPGGRRRDRRAEVDRRVRRSATAS